MRKTEVGRARPAGAPAKGTARRAQASQDWTPARPRRQPPRERPRAASRATWKGMLGFGLVKVPVRMYPAVRHEEMGLHVLHAADLGRIRLERVCAACGLHVDFHDLVRGYEYARHNYLPLTHEDLLRVRPEARREFALQDFVREEDIDPLLYARSFYLVPEGGGTQAYALLREALQRTGTAGLGHLVFRERDHLAAVRPWDAGLILQLLHFPEEMEPPMQAAARAQAPRKELDLALKLVESMTVPFHPERYQDGYREALRELVDRKLAGAPLRGEYRPPAPTKVIDLRARLRDSLEKAEGKHGRSAA